MNDDSSGCLFIIILGVAVWFFEISIFSDEISNYPQERICSDKKNHTNCNWQNLPSQTFRPIVETQTVLTWPTKKQWPITKIDNCSVANNKQWSCGESYVFGFSDGEFVSAFESKKFRYVSKIEWWFNKY